MTKSKINADGATVPAKAANIKQAEHPFKQERSDIRIESLAHYGDNFCGTHLRSINGMEGRHLMFEVVNSSGDREKDPGYKTLFLRKAVCRYLRNALSHFVQNQLSERGGLINAVVDFEDDDTHVDELLGKLRQSFERLIKEVETWSEA